MTSPNNPLTAHDGFPVVTKIILPLLLMGGIVSCKTQKTTLENTTATHHQSTASISSTAYDYTIHDTIDILRYYQPTQPNDPTQPIDTTTTTRIIRSTRHQLHTKSSDTIHTQMNDTTATKTETIRSPPGSIPSISSFEPIYMLLIALVCIIIIIKVKV